LQTSWPGQTGEIAVVQVAVALLQAKAHRLLGKFNEAEQLLLNIITASEKDECWGWVIESCVLMAVISQETNRDKLALKYLERALTLAEPEEYRRVFIEHGVQMEQLLRKVTGILEGQTSRSLQQYIVSLLNDFQGNQVSFNGGSRRSDDLARLTEREIRVLALMAGGLTNQQIADELVVSLSTVKTHVRNILNKLAVNNRTQATSMARQLGLI
jgi:LuxR family maltose regulon positive regulatory protein